jgi:hypothetical protein
MGLALDHSCLESSVSVVLSGGIEEQGEAVRPSTNHDQSGGSGSPACGAGLSPAAAHGVGCC